MRKLALCAAAAASILALTVASPTSDAAPERTETLLAPGSTYMLSTIARWRSETWHWQTLLGAKRTPTAFSARAARTPTYRRWVAGLWRERALAWRKRAQKPPHVRQWLCIFRHERHPRQGWNTNTGNGYYGGLQMDRAFMRRHAAWLYRKKGTADRWKPVEQIWVAERGRKVQGWYAWPNTARSCGLI